MSSDSENAIDPTLERARELNSEGFDWGHAWGRATLEHGIDNWPSEWGDDLHILIYGDFEAPNRDLEIPELSITIHHEKLERPAFYSARCVLKATVQIDERSVAGFLDAARRINVLLGTWTLVGWGNTACGWWCFLTHASRFSNGRVVQPFDHANLGVAIRGVLNLPEAVRQKLDAALYWIREPINLGMEWYRSDLFRFYSAYWNSFECLVEAVLILQPQEKLSKANKQLLIDEFLSARAGRLSSSDIVKCYQEIVNPGFVGKASHALKVCFADQAAEYTNECFKLEDRRNRLYDIRNAINHGDIDAQNLEEQLRVESRLTKLWIIVWGMFGRLVPFPAPVDQFSRGND